MNKLNRFKLDLQLFAEGGEPSVNPPADITLDDVMSRFKPEDILGHASLRSALDSHIGKSVNTALNNARAKWEQEHNENLSEAEKLAKMSKDEREKYQFKKDKEMFASEKAKFERDKLIVQAGTELNALGINPSLADFIVGKNAEDTKANMEKFTNIFNESISKAVESKLRGGETIQKAPPSTTITAEAISNMSASEINARWDEIQAALKNK